MQERKPIEPKPKFNDKNRVDSKGVERHLTNIKPGPKPITDQVDELDTIWKDESPAPLEQAPSIHVDDKKRVDSKGVDQAEHEVRRPPITLKIDSNGQWKLNKLEDTIVDRRHMHPAVSTQIKATPKTNPLASGSGRDGSMLAPKAPKPIDERHTLYPSQIAWDSKPAKKTEVVKIDKGGQWSLDKSNYGPKRLELYDPSANAKRKAKNTDTIEGVGPNRNVKQYTTTASTIGQMKDKEYEKKNKLQPVKNVTHEARYQGTQPIPKKTIFDKSDGEESNKLHVSRNGQWKIMGWNGDKPWWK